MLLTNSERIIREKELEVEELKRELMKFNGRVNGQLAFDMITSDEVLRHI